MVSSIEPNELLAMHFQSPESDLVKFNFNSSLSTVRWISPFGDILCHRITGLGVAIASHFVLKIEFNLVEMFIGFTAHLGLTGLREHF